MSKYFVIQRLSDGWYRTWFNYEWTFTPKSDNAEFFISEIDAENHIEKLPEGKYQIIKIYNV